MWYFQSERQTYRHTQTLTYERIRRAIVDSCVQTTSRHWSEYAQWDKRDQFICWIMDAATHEVIWIELFSVSCLPMVMLFYLQQNIDLTWDFLPLWPNFMPYQMIRNNAPFYANRLAFPINHPNWMNHLHVGICNDNHDSHLFSSRFEQFNAAHFEAPQRWRQSRFINKTMKCCCNWPLHSIIAAPRSSSTMQRSIHIGVYAVWVHSFCALHGTS